MRTRPGKPGNINVRVSDTARHLLTALQDHYGLSQSGILEMLLREDARRHGIPIPGSGADRARRAAAEAKAVEAAADARDVSAEEHSKDVQK